jgi:hypothetical protein
MSTKQAAILKDNSSRKNWGSTALAGGRGKGTRLLIGKVLISGKWRQVRSFAKWDLGSGFWSGVEVVTDATITLRTANNSGNSELAPSDGVRVKVMRVKKAWAEGSGTDWNADSGIWPPVAGDEVAFADGGSLEDTPLTFNVIKLLRMVAPKRVAFVMPNGETKNGLGYDDNGFVFMAAPESDLDARTEVWSKQYSTASKRPSLDIIYEDRNTAPVAGIVNPTGNVTKDFDIDGTFSDVNANDYMTTVKIQITRSSDTDWENIIIDRQFSRDVSPVDDQWHVEDGDYSKTALKKSIEYKVRAKVFDKESKASAWSPVKTFTITSDSPTVTADSFGTVSTLDGVLLGGATTVDSLTEMLTVDCQVLLGSTLLWSYSRPVGQGERDSDVVAVEYGGPHLEAGAYDYRVRVADRLGGQSTWSTGTFTLSGPLPVLEEDLPNITGYSNKSPSTRIVLLTMDASNRGPKNVKAIIEDAANVGISWYASAPGELYFTLPVTHPQVGACDPLVTHYRVEQYRRGRWKELAAGIIRDFDARENDVVVYGMDYLGLLSWSIEAATQPTTNHKKNIPTKVTGTNGSRYLQRTIKSIIKDQLNRARNQDSNSPVKFILTGTLGNFDTKVTIYASYAERLAFIRGLIDSHKGAQTTGGGERRSRLRVRYNQANKRYQFDALDNVGSDRDNIRLEYGSLIQGYQVIALGDYANLIYSIGKEPNKLKPHFQKSAAPNVSQKDWGSIGKSAFYPDVVDKNDLFRRARAEAIRTSRVGKQIALGLRVEGLDIWDGYDILDNIPIDINDGVVDTSLYGSGYWTIWGGEYRLYPDGHDEVTLIVRPKGDGAAIDTDLIPSDPIHAQAEWTWGSGPPS